MKYHNVVPIDKAKATVAFASGNPAVISDAMVRVAFHEIDRIWAESQFQHFLAHPNPEIRGLAATCIGDLARIHRSLDLNVTLPLLEKLRNDPEVAGRVQDALDDIEVFIRQRR